MITDTFIEQAVEKELKELDERMWAVEHLYDRAKEENRAKDIKILALNKAHDVLSGRLDKIVGAME